MTDPSNIDPRTQVIDLVEQMHSTAGDLHADDAASGEHYFDRIGELLESIREEGRCEVMATLNAQADSLVDIMQDMGTDVLNLTKNVLHDLRIIRNMSAIDSHNKKMRAEGQAEAFAAVEAVLAPYASDLSPIIRAAMDEKAVQINNRNQRALGIRMAASLMNDLGEDDWVENLGSLRGVTDWLRDTAVDVGRGVIK